MIFVVVTKVNQPRSIDFFLDMHERKAYSRFLEKCEEQLLSEDECIEENVLRRLKTDFAKNKETHFTSHQFNPNMSVNPNMSDNIAKVTVSMIRQKEEYPEND